MGSGVFSILARVALLAEGVDRNVCFVGEIATRNLSPSSQRAWIEIELTPMAHKTSAVALLAEGVDRNPSEDFYLNVVCCRPPRRGRG